MSTIKRLREEKGITQKQLADLVGVERSTVAKWETGTAFPGGAKLPKLARALGCTVADLFKEIEA